jgi:hypothetical protein
MRLRRVTADPAVGERGSQQRACRLAHEIGGFITGETTDVGEPDERFDAERRTAGFIRNSDRPRFNKDDVILADPDATGGGAIGVLMLYFDRYTASGVRHDRTTSTSSSVTPSERMTRPAPSGSSRRPPPARCAHAAHGSGGTKVRMTTARNESVTRGKCGKPLR